MKYNNKILTIPECQKEGNHHKTFGPNICKIETIIEKFKENSNKNIRINETKEPAAKLL